MRRLRIIDRTGRLFRAPDTGFDAAEIGAEAFGYNIPNRALTAVLMAKLGDAFLPMPGVTALALEGDAVRLSLPDGGTLDGAAGRRRGWPQFAVP